MPSRERRGTPCAVQARRVASEGREESDILSSINDLYSFGLGPRSGSLATDMITTGGTSATSSGIDPATPVPALRPLALKWPTLYVYVLQALEGDRHRTES